MNGRRRRRSGSGMWLLISAGAVWLHATPMHAEEGAGAAGAWQIGLGWQCTGLAGARWMNPQRTNPEPTNAEPTLPELANAHPTIADLANANSTIAHLTNADLTNAEMSNAGVSNSERTKPELDRRLTPPGAVAMSSWLGRPEGRSEKRPWQREKNATLAMMCSFLVPGLGQLYNERQLWTLVAAGVHFYFIGDIVYEARLTNRYRDLKNQPIDPNDPVQVALQQEAEVRFLIHRDNRTQSTWLLGLTLLLSGLQSFVDAHLFDFDANASLQLEPALGRVNGGALRLHF